VSGRRETYISSFKANPNNWSAKVNILVYTTKWRVEIFKIVLNENKKDQKSTILGL
jgi:hypothetical protein